MGVALSSELSKRRFVDVALEDVAGHVYALGLFANDDGGDLPSDYTVWLGDTDPADVLAVFKEQASG